MIRTLNLDTAKSRIWFVFLLLFILVFPKAGIKVGNLPLTVGYISLALSGIFCLFRHDHALTRSRLLPLLLLMPFQCCVLFAAFAHGIENISSFISLLTSFFFLPWIFLGVFSHFLETFDFPFFVRFLRNAMLFLAAYGIFVFFYRIVMGKLLVIPFLATNLSDADELEMTKHIVRRDWLKLISTYQNGIIYGVSLLILMPLYNLVETSGWKRILVKLALILTLTRTVWIGLVLSHVIEYFFQKKCTPKRFFFFCVQTGAGIAIFTWILLRLNFNFSFLFDSSLGGRIEQLETLGRFTLFGNKPLSGILEILYLGILDLFGIFGLIAFLIGISSPLWIYLLKKCPRDRIKESIAWGLVIYMVIACSDGAVQYIPIMAFYWFLSSLLLSSQRFEELLGGLRPR